MTRRRIPTALGEVSAEELGVTLAHEHLVVMTADSQAQWSEEFDEEVVLQKTVERLREVVAAGVRSVFDPTVDGLGRNVVRTRLVNEQVPELNIVVATGIYTWADEPFYFRFRSDREMVASFVRDLSEGIVRGGGIRAGFLKCAVDEAGLTRGVERILRNVAAAHRETGAPVMVHTHPGTRNAATIAEVLLSEGVHPAAVVLAHSGDSDDPDHLEELASGGWFLGMDRFAWPSGAAKDPRIDIVVEMCRRGWAGSMMLSHDAACYIDWISPQVMARLPASGYLYVDEVVVPALRAAGIGDAQIAEMRISAPARWMGFSA